MLVFHKVVKNLSKSVKYLQQPKAWIFQDENDLNRTSFVKGKREKRVIECGNLIKHLCEESKLKVHQRNT